jgi:hypothetical protein
VSPCHSITRIGAAPSARYPRARRRTAAGIARALPMAGKRDPEGGWRGQGTPVAHRGGGVRWERGALVFPDYVGCLLEPFLTYVCAYHFSVATHGHSTSRG